jgi:hypothetical protein
MQPHSHISDLIERYLDHAASVEEANELFDVMATDASVRAEFQAASMIRDNFAADIRETVLPDMMYADIVSAARAAGTLPVSEGITTLAGAASGGMSTVATAVQSTTLAIHGSSLAGLVASAASAIVALAVTTVVLTTPHGPDHVARPSGATMDAASTDASTQALQSPLPNTIPVPPSPVPDRTETSSSKRSPNHPSPASAFLSADGSSANGVAEEEASAMVAAITTVPTNARTIDLSLSEPPADDLNTEAASLALEPYLNIAPPFVARFTTAPLTAYSFEGGPATSGVNLSAEFEVRFADHHAVGVGLHHDAFPMTIIDASGSERTVATMTWASMHYRFAPEWTIAPGLTPWMQVAAGGSSRGMVLSPSLGLQQSFSNITVGMGASLMGFVYQSDDAWRVASRTALRVELGYRW